MDVLKVGIAMSGGVDSTVAAILLREQGLQVHGFFMVLPLPHQEHQERRVREVAARLALPLSLVDLRPHFADTVISAFVDSYRRGLTPNPCILCNRTIKFGLLADHMRRNGMDRIATGHYARIRITDGQPFLARAADQGKDQSYFLARLSAAQIAHCHFPLGEWTKEQAYRKAAALGLSFAGEESQDVCFLAPGLPEFLAGQGLGEQTGPVVGRHGRQLGEHRGCWRYTIGQRRGLGLPDATPWYVIALDGPANRVVVGKDEDLLLIRCAVQDL
jgi:tRNA-specific 2-thiouridylase